MSDVWEPWKLALGQLVRVRLSGECRVTMQGAQPPVDVSDDEIRLRTLAGEDVAASYANDEVTAGHGPEFDGVVGVVMRVHRDADMAGHFYRVMFGQPIGDGMVIGMDLAAAELEPEE